MDLVLNFNHSRLTNMARKCWTRKQKVVCSRPSSDESHSLWQRTFHLTKDKLVLVMTDWYVVRIIRWQKQVEVLWFPWSHCCSQRAKSALMIMEFHLMNHYVICLYLYTVSMACAWCCRTEALSMTYYGQIFFKRRLAEMLFKLCDRWKLQDLENT